MDGVNPTYIIISRQEAKALGIPNFYTGKPCKHGHDCMRSVHDGACKECRSNQKAEFFKKNKARLSAKSIKYATDNKDKSHSYTMKWRNKNKERFLSKQREWRGNNPEYHTQWNAENFEKKKEQSRTWRKNNPDKVKVITHKRRALMCNAEGKFSKDDIHCIRQMQRNKCAICRTSVKKKYHVDHIIPLSRGGSNWPRNLQLLCPTCNVRKSTKDPIKFMQERGFLL